jgi:tRNA (guanosine-2'-O-)-methyltransferase
MKGNPPGQSVTGTPKGRAELRAERRPRAHSCWQHLVVAPLWVAFQANLGTLLRTCDAVGACMAVPSTSHYRQALRCGNTLEVRSCVHWVHRPLNWLERERVRGSAILGVELAESSIRLADLKPATKRTIVLLGHEHNGIPDRAWPLLDQVVEIPMIGTGASLNVAVAGSLVLYRLAGLS